MDTNLDLISIATLLIPIAGMFLWNRSEANSDRRDMHNKLESNLKETREIIKQEMKKIEESLDQKFERIDQRFEKSIKNSKESTKDSKKSIKNSKESIKGSKKWKDDLIVNFAKLTPIL